MNKHPSQEHFEAAESMMRNGRPVEAEQHYRAALAADPRNTPALSGLATLCLKMGRTDEAVYLYQSAAAGMLDDPQALTGLGDALAAAGRHAEAEQVFQRLLTKDRNSAAGHFGLGNVLKQLGRFKEARQALSRAAALAPRVPAYHLALAETAPFTVDDHRLPFLERLEAEANDLMAVQQVEVHFALAKAFDDLKRYAEAFEQLQKGNTLYRGLVPYDEAELLGFFRELIAVFTPVTMESFHGTGHPSDLPVFIVGMPRSGTTLVEQVLASHPDVFGGGELLFTQDLILGGYAGPDYPADLTLVPKDTFTKFGGYYAVRLGALAPKARRITDKLPANFRHLGLIHLALPNARIIHVRRDPMDTCFSCYSKLFWSGLNYAYDLRELGHYYKAYDELMGHWRRVLPQGAMLEVQYEDLVSDFEAGARRLVEFCGLDWDERCLNFHENKRAVRTKSEFQVRQPVFQSSIGRWRPYEQWLSPLLEALR
jgi:tetratricopeptide (TPR) repeat protein